MVGVDQENLLTKTRLKNQNEGEVGHAKKKSLRPKKGKNQNEAEGDHGKK